MFFDYSVIIPQTFLFVKWFFRFIFNNAEILLSYNTAALPLCYAPIGRCGWSRTNDGGSQTIKKDDNDQPQIVQVKRKLNTQKYVLRFEVFLEG